MQRLGAERRVRADVDRGGEGPRRRGRPAGVDALPGQEHPARDLEVRSRKPEPGPPARTARHDPVDDIPPAERLGRPREVPVREGLADRGRRHGTLPEMQEPDPLHREARGVAERGQEHERSHGLMAEREVRSDDGVPGGEAVDQDPLDEQLCRQL